MHITEPTARDRAAATRKNKRAREQAPLLAWAGLVQEVTPDQAAERRVQVQTDAWWSRVDRCESEANFHVRADWIRYVVWSLVSPEQYAAICDWADHVFGPPYCRLSAWRKAHADVLAGGNGLPEAATITPVACWPELAGALLHDRETEERERHRAAGCTPKHCNIGQRERVVFRQTPRGFFSGDIHLDVWTSQRVPA